MTRTSPGVGLPLPPYRALASALVLWITGINLAFGAPPTCTLVKTSQFAVTVSPGAVPLVSGTINGVPAHLMLDTGAFFSVLSTRTTEKFHLRPEPGRRIAMVWVAGMEWGELAKVQDFSLEGLSAGTVHNIEFVLSSASLGGADGLLGENVLGVSDVEYDLANGIVRIFHPMNCGKQDPLAYWHGNSDVSVLETDIRTPRQPHIKSTARLDGVELRVLFDTGAPRSLLTRRAAIKAGYKPLGAGVTSQGFGAAGFTSARTWIGSFKMLELGGEVIKNVRLEVGEVQDRDPDFDLMLGADFFLAHRVYVAKSQRRMYFTYNGGPVFDLRSHDSAKVASANLAEPLPVPTGSPTPAAPPAPAGSGAPAARATPVTPVDAGSLPEGSDVPTDAAGFRLRAAASAARGDLASAYVTLIVPSSWHPRMRIPSTNERCCIRPPTRHSWR